MKTKLLKKTRNRFDIIHLPNGIFIDNKQYHYNLYQLNDNNSYYGDKYAQLKKVENGQQWCDDIFDTEKECIDFLKNHIIKILRHESPIRSTKLNNFNKKNKKVWYIK